MGNTVHLELLCHCLTFLYWQEKRVWMVWRAGNDTISSAEKRARWWHLTCVLKRRLHINFISRDRQRAEAGEFLAGTVYL